MPKWVEQILNKAEPQETHQHQRISEKKRKDISLDLVMNSARVEAIVGKES